MSSQLDNTSAILGEYMLKGWTLTDLHCDACHVTPLMREPAASASRESRAPIQFCALCDGGPSGSASSSAPASSSMVHTTSSPTPRNVTPAPTAADDAASQISALLLQGYSLLNDNCPHDTCKGIPLVGYPRRKDGSKDGRKRCVGCGSGWVGENELAGMRVVPPRLEGKGQGKGEEAESPRSKRRRELYGLDERGGVSEGIGKVKGKGKEVEELDLEEVVSAGEPVVQNAPLPHPTSSSSLHTALEQTASSLTLTLARLAASLEGHTTGKDRSDEARYFVDVKLHTEAMRDVLEVLKMVERSGTAARA